ncbi:PepSY domain-containing protein [Micromonospora sp. RTGN7]|uniref:PepSY domain-containing protein n=1 Tax=Micromonospora sp. RTGN7 TaxID=3016526 RepID=UPI0029FEFAA9|nr:PepSY domain-containing protein [Micromonospora sp. RTGN7]
MKRNSLIMASVGGAAMLAVAGVALGTTASDERAGRTTLAAATVAPAATGGPDGGVTAAPTSAPVTGMPTTGTPSGAASPSGAGPAAGGAVDERRAGEIALARAGGGRIVEVEAEEEDGRQVWSVEIVNGQTEHEVDVDRNDGAVVKAEQEPVDDDTDDTDDDTDDDDDDDDDDSDD